MNRDKAIKLVLSALATLWMFVVVFSYYIVHKPFSAENALAILNDLGDVIVAGLLLALGTAIGHRFTRSFAFSSPIEGLALSAGLGLGLMSLATLALGLAGLLYRPLFWGLLVVALVATRGDLQLTWKNLRSTKWPLTDRFDRFLTVFVAASVAIAFLFSLMPPTAWDTQTYHLVVAKVAMESGRIDSPPDIVYFSFPSLVEMLFLAGMLLKGDIAAQLVHFEFLLLTLGATWAFGRRYFNAHVGWLALAFLVAVPSLVVVSTWAYVDTALVFYTFAAFYAIVIARERQDLSGFVLSGAFAGFAMGVKYTAAIVPVALVLLLLLSERTRQWRDIITFGFAAGITAAPWFLRNLVFMGNPFYPFAFGGPYWDSFRAEWFSRFGTGLLNAPLQLLTAPWDATIMGREGGLGYSATIGPLLLALAPLLLLSWVVLRRPSSAPSTGDSSEARIIRDLLVFGGVLYLFWLVGIAESKLLLQTRLLFPAFPALALLAAAALDRLQALDLPQFSIHRFARLLIILIASLGLFSYMLAFAQASPLAYLTGSMSRTQVLDRDLGDYYHAVQFINTELPRNVRVISLWEPRSYYISRPVQPDAILDAWAHLQVKYGDADSIARALRSTGYTHVLLNRSGLDQLLQTEYDALSTQQMQTLQRFVDRDLTLVYSDHAAPPPIVDSNGQPIAYNKPISQYAIYEIKTDQAAR